MLANRRVSGNVLDDALVDILAEKDYLCLSIIARFLSLKIIQSNIYDSVNSFHMYITGKN